MTQPLDVLQRLDGHDRELFCRWTLGANPSTLQRRGWIILTHAGGAAVTIAAVTVPIVAEPWPRSISLDAAAALTISHLVVQGLKRYVHRDRPGMHAHIHCPDRFSFPSGHATAALAVSLSYGLAFPGFAVPLILLALIVGWSRVVLGVHYPGDVVSGQLIASLTVAGIALST